MSIIRKVIAAGKISRAVILPKKWLEGSEREAGHPINYVAIKLGRELRILPLTEKEVKPKL